MNESAIGRNLARLRREKKLTQASLAEAANISRVGYSKIERGKTQPQAETLRKLARALEVGIAQLVTPRVPLDKVRFRAAKKLAIRASVLVDVGRRLRDFTDLEKLLDCAPPYRLARVSKSIKRLKHPSPIEVATKVRAALNIGPDDTIRDICGLLEERAGVKVLSMPRNSDAFFGLSVASKRFGHAIVVNTWERISVERWIFTAAHELGHLVMHDEEYQENSGQKKENAKAEKEANVFASHFLMPAAMLEREWNHTRGMNLVERVLHIKRIFKVSYQTVLYRLSEILPIGKGIWPEFLSRYEKRYKRGLGRADEPIPLKHHVYSEALRSKEPDYLSPMDFAHDRFYRLVRQAIEEQNISISRGAEILGLSLGQMRDTINGWIKEPELKLR